MLLAQLNRFWIHLLLLIKPFSTDWSQIWCNRKTIWHFKIWKNSSDIVVKQIWVYGGSVVCQSHQHNIAPVQCSCMDFWHLWVVLTSSSTKQSLLSCSISSLPALLNLIGVIHSSLASKHSLKLISSSLMKKLLLFSIDSLWI